MGGRVGKGVAAAALVALAVAYTRYSVTTRGEEGFLEQGGREEEAPLAGGGEKTPPGQETQAKETPGTVERQDAGNEPTASGANKHGFRLAKKECPAAYPYDPMVLLRKQPLNKTDQEFFQSLVFPKPPKCLHNNIFFIKMMKSGSSTMSGVIRRVGARNMLGRTRTGGVMFGPGEEPKLVSCQAVQEAVLSKEIQISRSGSASTFVFGIIREPVKQCLSMFYHFFFRHRAEGDNRTEGYDEEIIDYCSHRDSTLGVLSIYEAGKVDFIAVTDRYVESVVLLGSQLDLSVADVLYTKSKDSSKKVKDITFRLDKDRRMIPDKPLRQHSQRVQDFFADAFRNQSQLFYKVFEDANRKMDDMIDQIGRPQFEKTVALVQAHLTTVAVECNAYTEDGDLKPGEVCFWRDNGCSQSCLNEYSTTHDLWDLSIQDLLRQAS